MIIRSAKWKSDDLLSTGGSIWWINPDHSMIVWYPGYEYVEQLELLEVVEPKW